MSAITYTEYYNACISYLGTPNFTPCSYVFWNNKYSYMQGVVDTYYSQAPYLCPGGRDSTPQCVEFYINYDNAIQALGIAAEAKDYWTGQMFG